MRRPEGESATGVTLRQLHYRLVADPDTGYPNLQSFYKRLSERTAEARREGTFPDLIDRTSTIVRPVFFDGPADAQQYLLDVYQRDRTEGQPWSIYLGAEKDGMSEQLSAWFTDDLGVPHVALGGWASQTLADEVRRDIENQGRPAVLLYAGDFDPSGEFMPEDFERRVRAFDRVERIALTLDQIEEYDLPFNPDPEVAEKIKNDTRIKKFRERYGFETDDDVPQYEVDALPPEDLRGLYQDALDAFWDPDAYTAALAREEDERGRL